MENIRSYTTCEPIHFPLGISLFEGDVHAGKSTLLYAIEFALFGLGDFKGSFLLRNGSKKGSVTLTFEEEGQDYEVHRGLVKNQKAVHQDDCYIKGPSGKQILSTTDLKEKILQILRFNEPPNPRAQSMIYRYAIFTPQEQMKEIINKDAEARLQTLRKAFRLEDYKIAAQNSLLLKCRIEKTKGYLQNVTEDLESNKSELNTIIFELKILLSKLAPAQHKEASLLKQKRLLEEEKEKLEIEKERLGKIEARIPFLSRQIDGKDSDIRRYNDQIEKLKGKLVYINSQVKELGKIKSPSNLSVLQLEQKRADLLQQIEKVQKLEQNAAIANSHLPLLNNSLQNATKSIYLEKDCLMKKQKEREQLVSNIGKYTSVKPTEKTLAQLDNERLIVVNKQKEIDHEISKHQERISNFLHLIENNQCPICERTADSQDFGRKKSILDSECEKLKTTSKILGEDILKIDEIMEALRIFIETDKDLRKAQECLKEIDEALNEVGEKINELESEQKKLGQQIIAMERESKKLTGIQEKIKILKENCDKTSDSIELVRTYERARMDIGRYETEKKESEDGIKQYESVLTLIEDEKNRLLGEKAKAGNELKIWDSIIEQIGLTVGKITETENNIQKVRSELISTRTSISHYNSQKEKLQNTVKSKEAKRVTMKVLYEHESWLEQLFRPALEAIEKHVMESLRRRFNEEFQKWFNILIEDPSLTVNMNESFSPEINRDGFDQEYAQLSGGERTSVALAYRLALNILVQDVTIPGYSSLLILDEPTEGFSKEQLYRLRQVIGNLKCPQIIIVSHERELEGFADNIINVRNSNGISSISVCQR